MSLKDEIRAAVANARRPGQPQQDPYRRVLEEVAQGLTTDLIQAYVCDRPGGRYLLFVGPAYRPGRASPILSVVREEDGARLLIENPQSLQAPAALATALKEFVQHAAFLETLEIFESQAQQSVEGYLRCNPDRVSRADVLLEVTATTQKKLANSEGKVVDFYARVSEFPGAGRHDSKVKYLVLQSAGLTIVLRKPTRATREGILVEGTVSPIGRCG